METIEMPPGATLIPVNELERIAAERRRRTPTSSHVAAPVGRRPSVRAELVERIRAERLTGGSLRKIADGLNADRIPTAHGGERWWPSTVRAVLRRAA
jgi:hypothetical protein